MGAESILLYPVTFVFWSAYMATGIAIANDIQPDITDPVRECMLETNQTEEQCLTKISSSQ